MNMADKSEYNIRVPVKMVQITDVNGQVRPIMFDWQNPGGDTVKVKIDRVVSMKREAEHKSGTVGDRFEVDIDGRREYLYYTLLSPRKWFMIVAVSENEYKEYYRLPGEAVGIGA
jgi:hypothetical protein